MMLRMSSDTLVVVRGEFSMEDPWAILPACNTVRLRRSTDGAAPRLSTTVSAYFDDEYLTIVFCGADDHIVATMFGHDDPLYDEDVVEVFLAPRTRSQYFEVEVSPLGTTFDARIDSPEGVRPSMKVDMSWHCTGLLAAVRKRIESRRLVSLDTVMRIPFDSMRCRAPRNGDVWHGNLFRIDRHPSEGDEYSAWRPTMRTPADFHVTESFGRLLFQA